jgi:hypothetical protein
VSDSNGSSARAFSIGLGVEAQLLKKSKSNDNAPHAWCRLFSFRGRKFL